MPPVLLGYNKNIEDYPYDPEAAKKLLAEAIGVEAEDINLDDLLTEDLHMMPSDLADFSENLESRGIALEDIDLTSLVSVEDLIEAANSKAEI